MQYFSSTWISDRILLMSYTYPPEEYAARLKEYTDLEKMSFSPDDSRQYIIGKLEERSSRKRVIAGISNRIIREYIDRFEKDPDTMTAEDAALLNAFHSSLTGISDHPISYRISRILSSYYHRTGDLNNYALFLSQSGFHLSNLVNNHSSSGKDSPFFVEWKSLMDHIGDLDGNARFAAIRLVLQMTQLGPDTFAKGFPYSRYQTICDVLENHLKHSDAGYRDQIMFITYTNMLDTIREYYVYERDHGVEADMVPLRPMMVTMVGYLQKYLKKNITFDREAIIGRYNLLTARFILKEIDLDQLLDGFEDIQKEAETSRDLVVQLSAVATMNRFYLIFLHKFSSKPKEEIMKLARERVRETVPRIIALSETINNPVCNSYISMFLNAASMSGDFESFKKLILDITVSADKALYIHTLMVREMSRAIFDYMIGRTPGFFDGVAGFDSTYISTHRDEMRALLDDCCMFHDAGKFFVIDIVENSMRRLTAEEFDLVKKHPYNFNAIYNNSEENDQKVICIRDIAMTHHLWHDGKHGYPAVKHTNNRPFADIISIADSIDAATDFLGRPYNSGKNIDQLTSEFQAGAGTHYAAEVVAALSAPQVRDRLQYLITEGRREIYYQIYAFNELREKV